MKHRPSTTGTKPKRTRRAPGQHRHTTTVQRLSILAGLLR